MKYVEKPLVWYTDLLRSGADFTSLIYGDGELMVALGMRTGEAFTGYEEVVTDGLVQEMVESLKDPSKDILRGTDFNVLNSKYHDSGRLEGPLEELLGPAHEDLEWLDGTVWEESCRVGKLGPVFEHLAKTSNLVMVGNKGLAKLDWLRPRLLITVPERNAWSKVDEIERDVLHWWSRNPESTPPSTYVINMGLGSTPLIMRLRRRLKGTFLDLGSNFDLFWGGDSWRAWRAELYADKKQWDKVIADNLSWRKP